MKLEEAAAILGVHPDTPIETLKQTYRRLALAWHPDKCSNPNAKEKFQQISIAYTKLISAQSIGGKRLEDEDSDDDAGGKRGVESHEMAAFMRMFMDLVGIFNEDQSLSEDGKIPAAGVSFGMMFGSRPGTAEEWSTEDEADAEELDDEVDEDEDDDDECYGSEEEEAINPDGSTTWEPPAKHYSQMNLKEEASKARQSRLTEETEKGNELLEAKRKLKNAKKRAEKRRKQKEKKMREAAVKEDEEEELRQIEETKKREEEEAAVKRQNELRLLMEAKVKQRVDLFGVLRSGSLAKVKAFIGETLDNVKPNKSSSNFAFNVQRTHVMRELVASQPLLHCCVGEPSSHLVDIDVSNKGVGDGRLAIAKFLLGQRTRPLNLGITDDDGRTALHLAAKREDSAMIRILLAAREENPDRKAQLDLNARCNKSGWTPLHYAASQGDVTSLRLLLEAGSSFLIHAGTGKGATALEVVKSRLQNAGHFSAAHIANLQLVAKELSEAVRTLEKVKQLKEAERLLKEEKLEAARKKLAEREEKERELLERKQKQLKDKQDRDRTRDVDDDSNKKHPKHPPSAAPSASVTPTKSPPSSTQLQNPSLQFLSTATSALTPNPTSAPVCKSSAIPPSTPTTSNTATAASIASDSAQKASKKKLKKDRKKEEEEATTPVIPIPPVPKSIVVDVASRDELVDHLLAMGFPEADCLQAISLYGKDVDLALSWLCDRPAAGTAPKTTAVVSTATASTHVRNDSSISQGGLHLADNPHSTETMRLQKEKDHKEELRRINRAWNQKTEDEKRRADAEKKQKEDDRQKEAHLQQLLQKQQQHQQQQILQQQHLQQLLVQHQVNLQQHAQQMQQQQQILQRSPGLPSYPYGIPSKGDMDLPVPPTFAAQGGPGTRQFQVAQGQLPNALHSQNIDGHGTRMDHTMSYLNARSSSPLASSNPLGPSGSMYGSHNILGLNNGQNMTPRGSNGGSLSNHEIDISHGRDDMKGLGRGMSSGLSMNSSYDVSAYNELQVQAHLRAAANNHLGSAPTGSAALGGHPLPSAGNHVMQVLQYDSHDYQSNPSGISQARMLHQLPYTQSSQQHYSSTTQLPLPQMRPISSGQSPLGWDDTGRPRNMSCVLPGQSQQVFQSQQQLQEQESSRLHHQSRQYQYAINESHSIEDDEFVDNSLELSVKAKPFVPQYSTKSPISSMPPPMTSTLGMNSLLLSHQSQGYMNNGSNTVSSLGGLPLSSPSMSDPWGAAQLPQAQHLAQHGSQRAQVFDKHGPSSFNMSMLPSLSPITAAPLGPSTSLHTSLSAQSSPYSAILRSFSNDRTLNPDPRPAGKGHSSYPPSLGGSLLHELGSTDHYGSDLVDDLEREDSYPDAIPSLLSGLLLQKSLNISSVSREGLGSGSDRFSNAPELIDTSRDLGFIRDRTQNPFRDQGGLTQKNPPDLFGGGVGFGSGAFGGRSGPFMSGHLGSGNQDPAVVLMRGTGHGPLADR